MRRPATKFEPAPMEASAPDATRPSFPAWLMAVLLLLATVLAYQPVWHAGFIWDDDFYVTNNPTLHSLDGLRQIWCKLTATPQYYPLVHTSFWLEYHLWGLNPLGYHVVNVLLHALAAILLWRVLARLQLPGAWLAAGIFALHPVAVESVAWVTERKNVLAAVFYFAAALACLRWTEEATAGGKQIRNSFRWYFLSLALFVAALLSKTTACSLPAAMLLVIWWKRGRIAGRDVWPLLPFFAAGMAMGLVTSWLERTHVGAQGPEWAFSFPERCLIAGRAAWFYAGKLFWPADLTFIYPRWQLNTGEWWQWIFPVAALAVVMVLWRLRRRIGRGPLVAVLFFGGTLLPALGFTNVYPMLFSFVADHFQYLAGVGLMVLTAVGVTMVLGFLGKGNLLLKPVCYGALLLTLGVLTWRQCRMYSDIQTLWQATIDRNPACWMAHNGLANTFLDEGQTDKAISQYQEAIRIKPDYSLAYSNLGFALLGSGQTDEAISQFHESLRLNPDYAGAHLNLGNALLKKGRTDEAISEYLEAIRLKPDNALAHLNLGNVLLNKGQIGEAMRQYQEAVGINPEYSPALANFGAIIALNNQAWVLATSPDANIRDGAQAVKLAERACELTHYQTTIMVGTLAAAYAEAGRFDEAVATGQKACALASEMGVTNLLKRNQELVALYQARQPYHEPPK